MVNFCWFFFKWGLLLGLAALIAVVPSVYQRLDAEVCRRVDNLYVCTCPFLSWESTERFVETYGADRLLFGSDLMDLPIGWGLGPILYAKVTEEDKRKILGGNLRRLMDQYDTHPHGWQVVGVR